MSRRPATLEEVARVAGVSRATVSRVINDSPRVSARAREAVATAVRELGYAPNRAARSLVTRRSDSIGLLVAESEQRVFGEPFFAGLVRGVSTALAETEIQLVLLLARTEQDRGRVERFLTSHLDGVMLISAHFDDPLLGRLASVPTPVVLAGRPPSGIELPYVDADNLTGARSVVEHLVGRGRRRIATIAGPQDLAPGIDRLAGYREGLRATGLGCDEQLIAYGDFTDTSGARGADDLLQRAGDIDALFAASDLMAVGAMRALTAAGRRVPQDVAVVGFDDSELARNAVPSLSSVRQPVEAIGRELVARLRGALDGEDAISSATILPTELHVRESS